MTLIVIHAGFHKTGTTSVQSLIDANRATLQRRIRPFLKADFDGLTEAARAFSLDPGALTLAEVTHQAEAFFATVDPADTRPVLMSSEDLSGHLPGRHGLTCYDAAALVMSQIADVVRHRFGPDGNLVFFFSTRARDPWLRSTWWQNLRSTRLTEDFDNYAERIAPAADLPAVVAEVRDAVSPYVVRDMALEDSTTMPEGPLSPLLDLLPVPPRMRRRLTLLDPENVQPALGLEPVFLALNRSGLNDRALALAKKHIRRLANNPPQSG